MGHERRRILEEEDGAARLKRLDERIHKLFGSRLDEPKYIAERGEISMSYRTHDGLQLDLSACGRDQQQTMLLLAHMAANPESVLLLDEPDAHLEILCQRQIYQVSSETADETRSQIIAASHSEVMRNEAAGRDVLIAFVGKPQRLGNRGSQVAKALKDNGVPGACSSSARFEPAATHPRDLSGSRQQTHPRRSPFPHSSHVDRSSHCLSFE